MALRLKAFSGKLCVHKNYDFFQFQTVFNLNLLSIFVHFTRC